MRRKKQWASGLIYSFGDRERVCPVCGKTWIMRCRPDEWGYWYKHSDDQIEGRLVLLCSDACSRAYARRKLDAEIAKVRKLRSWTAWRMWQEGKTCQEIGEALGVASGTVLGLIEQLMNTHGHAVDVMGKEGIV